MVTLIDGEIRTSALEDQEKVSTKSLDRALGLVGEFLGWWDALHVDMLLLEKTH
jgi:hypothetical protein